MVRHTVEIDERKPTGVDVSVTHVGDIFEVLSTKTGAGPVGQLLMAVWFDSDRQSFLFVDLRDPSVTYSDAMECAANPNNRRIGELGWRVRVLAPGTKLTLTVGERR